MSSLNKVILIGNLGRDPEVRYTEGGGTMAKFSLATTESFKNREGQRVENTDWHNIVAFNKLGEFAEKWLKKGMKVYIEGRMRTRKWQDDKQNDRYTTEVVCDDIRFMDTKRDREEQSDPEGPISMDEYESPLD